MVRGEPEPEPVLPTRQLILRQAGSNGGSVCGDAREQKLRRIGSPSLREAATRRYGLIAVGVVQARQICPDLVLMLGAAPPAKQTATQTKAPPAPRSAMVHASWTKDASASGSGMTS